MITFRDDSSCDITVFAQFNVTIKVAIIEGIEGILQFKSFNSCLENKTVQKIYTINTFGEKYKDVINSRINLGLFYIEGFCKNTFFISEKYYI